MNANIFGSSQASGTPPIDEPVMVSYAKYECLAYCDPNGKWHNWYTDKEIDGVVEWVPLPSE